MGKLLAIDLASKRSAAGASAIALLSALCVFSASVPLAFASHNSEHIARMAMSTASLWMIEHHEHEIAEGLEKGDVEEALEEAEELVSWIKAAPWLAEVSTPAEVLTAAVQTVVSKLSARDTEGAEAAFKTMKMKAHHLHEEVMEAVAEEGTHSN